MRRPRPRSRPGTLSAALLLMAGCAVSGTETGMVSLPELPTPTHSEPGGDDLRVLYDIPEWAKVPPDPWWSPGDEVPGWPSFACDLPTGPNVLRWEGLQYFGLETSVSFGHTKRGRELYIKLVFNNCLRFGCSGWPVDYSLPLVVLTEFQRRPSPLGGYPEVWSPDVGYTLELTSPFGRHETDHGDPDDGRELHFCVEEARPDVFRAFASIRYAGVYPFEGRHYDEWWLVVPLEFRPSRHAGMPVGVWYGDELWWPSSTDEALRLCGEGGYFRYEQDERSDPSVTYESAWPWEQVTDPAIRSALYWSFTPSIDLRYAWTYEYLGFGTL